MSSVHCVVVWEWQCNGQWLPHTPGVTRTLERAHAKKLTRVVLADADPALRGHHVNLRTLTQCLDTSDGGSAECGVRRSCYSVQSPAGRGARWEWARFVSPPLGGELNYEPLPMEVQCLLEESWSVGGDTVTFEGWIVSVPRMTARAAGGNALALLRRAPHPPYPLTRTEQRAAALAPHPPPPPPPPPPDRVPLEGRRPRIPQQHTGSSVHSVQSVQSMHSLQSMHSIQSIQSSKSVPCSQTVSRGGARSASPRDRKPGFRQILHNLNIFSHNNKQPVQIETKHNEEIAEEQRTDTECSSTRSGRRHSVDTVSTYLSHESKESLQQAAVGELLNCSTSSDDVFDTSPPPLSPTTIDVDMSTSDGSIVGVDAASSQVCVWVRAAPVPQWGALCPACLLPLEPGPAGPGGPAPGPAAPPAVALVACAHMLHLHCLNRQLEALRANREPLYIECLVCGRVYGPGGRAPPACGEQPAGSMAWALQPHALPQHPHCTSSILVTYNFQSGRQGPRHPVPGAPYYAVGFPRHSVLPDTALGRQVLSALRSAWERGVLFRVSASVTTGREHVVAWRVAPPPAAPQQYAPPADPQRLLRAALHRLHALAA